MSEINNPEFLKELVERCNTLSFYRESERETIAYAGFHQLENTELEGAVVYIMRGLGLEA